MKLARRAFLALVAAAGLSTAATFARAQDYPVRPVRLLVGYASGGVTDISARLIGEWLSVKLGRSLVVENRPGASSNIATGTVARATPDGYTLLLASTSNAFNATLYDRLDFNFIRDLAPVASIGRDAFVLAANPSFAAKTVPELIAHAKANPGKVTLGSSGPGSASALFGELFKVMAGADLFTVHYRSVGPALPDLMSGRVDVMFAPVASVIGYIRSGQLRPLGVTPAARVGVLPDVPTIGEFVPGYEGSGWVGMVAPRNTPPQIVAILNKQVNAALADPTFKTRIADLGMEPFATSPAEFGKFIAAYSEKWGKVIRDAGIKAE
ncbi:MAG TPA: tripartite tricarboxylate transporter substrate binding protein [Xanthobacteraceae bacterium]|jgi:tripartite-type tricarboxylate transporter receptor subunit TctC|nr:tripartite tricarboxylate transporter substrate binding protein [Xanthobacteraceae bacterium]